MWWAVVTNGLEELVLLGGGLCLSVECRPNSATGALMDSLRSPDGLPPNTYLLRLLLLTNNQVVNCLLIQIDPKGT